MKLKASQLDKHRQQSNQTQQNIYKEVKKITNQLLIFENDNFIFFILLTLLFLLYQNALTAFFRFDDGIHLAFVLDFNPIDYFFNPEITGYQSNFSFVTPINALTYSINSFIYGFNPKWYYFNQIILIWFVSIATYLLLKSKTSSFWAFFGATLFIISSPTLTVINELMTGHYILGLLFSIISLSLYIKAIDTQNYKIIYISILFYILAISSKEIFVPLIIFFLFIPETKISFRRKIIIFLPYLLILAIYLLWRYKVLGGQFIGGYNPSSAINFDLQVLYEKVKAFLLIPYYIFGKYNTTSIILLIIGLLSLFLFKKNVSYIIPVAVGISLIIIPLIPVYSSIEHNGRYLLLPSWAIAIYLSILLSKVKLNFNANKLIAIILIILSFNFSYNLQNNKFMTGIYKCHDTVSKFILNSNSKQIFYDSDNAWYSSSLLATRLKQALEASSKTKRAKVISDITNLSLDELQNYSVFTYDFDCECMVNITNKAKSMILSANEFRKYEELNISVFYSNYRIHADFGPYIDGKYEIFFKIKEPYQKKYDPNFIKYSVPNKASFGTHPNRSILIYVKHIMSDGSFIKSNTYELSPVGLKKINIK
jgi:hypothetical protein